MGKHNQENFNPSSEMVRGFVFLGKKFVFEKENLLLQFQITDDFLSDVIWMNIY